MKVSTPSFPFALHADGLAQSLIASVSDVPGFMTPVVVECLADERESETAGVGQNEDPLPLLRTTDFLREYSCPLRIEPARGKVTEDSVESQSNVA